jgi:hypothetical protein
MELRRRPAFPAAANRGLIFLLLAFLILPAAFAQTAANLPLIKAAGAGQKVQAPDLESPAELVRFDPELVPLLLALPAGARVRIADWPVAPGERKDVLLARHEVYAPGARILKVEGETTTEVPRSRLVFLWGLHAGDPLSGVFIAVDPQTRTVESLSHSAAGTFELRPLTPGKPGLHLVASAHAFSATAAKGHKLDWNCGVAALPGAATPPRELVVRPEIAGEGASSPAEAPWNDGAAAAGAGAEIALTAASSLRTATVAIDTDAQLLANKFSNDTTTATNYIASLFAAINVMYNRDLQIQLAEGTTILRVGTDPYTQKDNGAASPGKLSEVSTYWAANYGSIQRTVTTMLSGLGSAYSASGIAWVSGLCSSSYGYSFSQVFLSNQLSLDALIVGHENGHNFGSIHTHCYSPPIDECYNLEPGCYSGPTSCPAPSTINGVANVLGTIMGYCHLLGGCNTSQVFHPRTVAVVQPEISAALGICINGAIQAPSLTAVNPQAGPTAGNNTVTLKGSGFTGATGVTFGGQNGTAVNVVDDGTITVRPPAHSTGAVAVAVSTGGGASTLSPGYFYAAADAATSFYTVAPCRLLDTRNANGPQGGPVFGPGASRVVQATGVCGVPAGAKAIAVNVTVVSPGAAGDFTLYPGNAFPFNTSTVNFAAGQVRANNAVAALASDGSGAFGLKNSSASTSHFLVDVSGYFK